LFSREDGGVAWLIDANMKLVSVEKLALLLSGIRIISSFENGSHT